MRTNQHDTDNDPKPVTDHRWFSPHYITLLHYVPWDNWLGKSRSRE